MIINDGIAIIGIDCRYPGANNTDQFWENILSLRQQFRRIPDKRLNLNDYFSKDKSKVDSTYSQKASVISNYQFDRMKYKVSKSAFDRTDMTHWLALDVAAGALKDAGLENGEGLDKNRVGVVIGNSLTGEFTRSGTMRLRWPYVGKVLESTLKGLNYSKDEIIKILTDTEKIYKNPFPEPDADSLAGGLSNTIGGRICNYFDFHGGGFTIDGACSSSLLAFENGCNSILNGSLDAVLVGGVDLSIDPFEVIGFARNGALAANEMEVYSSKSEGFWPGEGCGMVVLMKESDAIARNLNIYSVIKGWGISSDGNGGITRPKSDTQQLAFDRAYQRAGYDIGQVSMFEGHGTGTPLGDQVEITALVNSLKEANKNNTAAILGSVKHLIGHTKAAAGVAGVIKASLALKYGIIPPSRSNSVHPILKENEKIIKLETKPTLWEGKTPMRASVSSMGFGGINVHLTMQEASNVKRNNKLSGKVTRLADSQRDCEIFPISANSKQSLLDKIQRLESLARDISRSEFIDLSATISASFQDNGIWKASVVAANPDVLKEGLELIEKAILENKTRLIDINKGIFFDSSGKSKKIGFLFPGQGSPIYSGWGAFKSFVEKKCEIKICSEGVADTSVAQPAILQSSLQSVELLEKFGIEADFAIGHSLGEISALAWAGVIDSKEAVDIARDRGRAMSEFGEKDGAMLALKCDEITLEDFTSNHQVTVTGYNGNGNFVIGGHINEINEVQAKALEQSIHHVKLKVSHAFHTPMMQKAALQFKQSLENRTFERPQKKVISTVLADEISDETNTHELLFNQIEAPVYFTQSVDKIKDENILLIEVGPGNSLSRSLQEYNEFEVISLDFGSNSLRGLLNTLSLGYISGNGIAFDELSNNRFYKEFDVENWKLDVFVNPCEDNDFESSTIKEILDAPSADNSSTEVSNSEQIEVSLLGVQRFLKKTISNKIEIPYEMVNLDDRLMSQLHINSLAITEIISLVIKTFNKSQLVFSEASILANADGSIEELSKVIFAGENGGTSSAEKGKVSFEAAHNWSHIFQRNNVAKKSSSLNVEKINGNVIIKGDETLIAKLNPVLMNAQIGDVAVFVYTSSLAEKCFFNFVAFLQEAAVKNSQLIALINIKEQQSSGDLKPILRTYQLENPNASTISIELSNTDSLEVVVKELKNVAKYKEVVFDKSGQRYESEIEFFYPEKAKLTDTISADDVILATGGGKGITFESIFSLAKASHAKLVILGRSLPENDSELKSNLERLDENLIKYRYYSADVCSEESVHEALLKSVLEFGDITVFVHGAGVNNPKPLQLLTPIDFDKTSYVKVQGIKNVVKELNLKSMKLIIGYGSIIAESGMHGNADYAWANDQLAHYINQVGSENPHCRCMTLEWSVWSETGMGVSLNTIETLKQKGVWPIPVSHGVEILKAIVADTNYKGGRLIISGRYGDMPTLNYTKKRLPLGRFISSVKHYVPKVELVSEVNISVKDDIYLQNHIFQGQYVFPTVMILEGMSQVCSVLTDETDFWVFEDLKINKSIFIPKNEINKIRFIVTRISKNTFKAIVQSEDSNFEVNCFEAYLKLGKKPDFKLPENDFINRAVLGIDVETKFYDDLLFHDGPFRRINSFLTVNALESIAQVSTSLNDAWFGDFLPAKMILGDAGLNDAAIHCHQACRPHNNLLPTAVGEIAFNCAEIEGPFFIHTSEIYDRDTTARIDVYVMNTKGEVKQMWKSLDLTRVSGSKFNGEWNAHFLTTYIEYVLMKLAESTELSVPETLIRNINLLASEDITSVNEDIFGYSVSLKKQLEPSPLDLTRSNSLFFIEISLMSVEPKIILEINSMGTNDTLDLKTMNYANN